MLIFKFTKTKTAALVSHVDNLRAMTYIFRRAGVRAQYSQGFNPHMELGFSPPIQLGVESLAEYVSVKTDQIDNLLDRLNAVTPSGITFEKQWCGEINLAAKFNRARYRLECGGIGDVIDEILEPHFCVTYADRGQIVTKDVHDRIFSAERIDCNCAIVTLAVGNSNLRPDRLVLHLAEKHDLLGDYRITKLATLLDETDADDILSALQQSPAN